MFVIPIRSLAATAIVATAVLVLPVSPAPAGEPSSYEKLEQEQRQQDKETLNEEKEEAKRTAIETRMEKVRKMRSIAIRNRESTEEFDEVLEEAEAGLDDAFDFATDDMQLD